MRIMIAGGGTGGHVYPGVAICDALRRRSTDVEVLFVGARAGVEGRLFAELGLPHVLLPGRGVRGKGLLGVLASPFVLAAGVLCGVREVLSFRPDVVVGTGGYASVAAVVAAVLCRRPRVLQEQNSVPGMANRLLSRFADLVLLSYEGSKAFLKGGASTAVVGNPIRLEPMVDRAAGAGFFGIEPGLPTVLVWGGSRGARTINRAATDAVPLLLERRKMQFVFLTGQSEWEEIASRLARFAPWVKVLPFLHEMRHAYSVADVAVSRAGASAVFELAAFGVPTVFVPYPYAADDHQRRNVEELSKTGAAVVVDNAELDGARLQTILEALLDDDARRKDMADRMRRWARPDAAEMAAERIVDLVSRRIGSRAIERAAVHSAV